MSRQSIDLDSPTVRAALAAAPGTAGSEALILLARAEHARTHGERRVLRRAAERRARVVLAGPEPSPEGDHDGR